MNEITLLMVISVMASTFTYSNYFFFLKALKNRPKMFIPHRGKNQLMQWQSSKHMVGEELEKMFAIYHIFFTKFMAS